MLGWIRGLCSRKRKTARQEPVSTTNNQPLEEVRDTTALNEESDAKALLEQQVEAFFSELTHFRNAVIGEAARQLGTQGVHDAVIAIDLKGRTVTASTLRNVIVPWLKGLYPNATLLIDRYGDSLTITISPSSEINDNR